MAISVIDEKDFSFCEHCIYSKSKRVSFNKGQHTTRERLDYIHFDLWGRAEINSLSDGMYFMTLIDVYSWKFWVCILETKEQAVENED